MAVQGVPAFPCGWGPAAGFRHGPGCTAGSHNAEQRWARGEEMTAILGISAYYHDSAAAVVIDGEIVAAAQEERFSRKKHDPGFPSQAIAYCLQEAGLSALQLDYVAFYDKPLSKFERLLETYLAYAPR